MSPASSGRTTTLHRRRNSDTRRRSSRQPGSDLRGPSGWQRGDLTFNLPAARWGRIRRRRGLNEAITAFPNESLGSECMMTSFCFLSFVQSLSFPRQQQEHWTVAVMKQMIFFQVPELVLLVSVLHEKPERTNKVFAVLWYAAAQKVLLEVLLEWAQCSRCFFIYEAHSRFLVFIKDLHAVLNWSLFPTSRHTPHQAILSSSGWVFNVFHIRSQLFCPPSVPGHGWPLALWYWGGSTVVGTFSIKSTVNQNRLILLPNWS